MTDLIFAGFDVSSTGAGFCLMDSNGNFMRRRVWQIDEDAVEGIRLYSLWNWAADCASSVEQITNEEPNLLVSWSMEGPFARGRGAKVLARAQGAVMVGCGPVEWTTYQPTEIKAEASRQTGVQTQGEGTGGRSDGLKPEMLEAWRKRWPGKVTDAFESVGTVSSMNKAIGDVVDACWVAETDRVTTMAILRSREN